MRKHYYTKLRNLLTSANELHLHAHKRHMYLSEGHMVVKMPVEMYEEHFHSISPCDFPILGDDEKRTRNLADWYTHPERDLAGMWEKMFDDTEKYLVRSVGSGKYSCCVDKKVSVKSVRFCKTDYDRVMLNPRFYDAMEQAARGGLMYGHTRRQPVWFFDMPQIHESGLYACVLPIMYQDCQVVA